MAIHVCNQCVPQFPASPAGMVENAAAAIPVFLKKERLFISYINIIAPIKLT